MPLHPKTTSRMKHQEERRTQKASRIKETFTRIALGLEETHRRMEQGLSNLDDARELFGIEPGESGLTFDQEYNDHMDAIEDAILFFGRVKGLHGTGG